MASADNQPATSTDNPPVPATNNDNKQNDDNQAAAATMPQFIDTTSIVIDNGGYHIKAGHGGDDLPRIVIPNMYGKSVDNPNSAIIYGKRALFSDKLSLTYPMDYQLIKDFSAQELIWNHLLTKKLKINPSQQNILLTEPALNPKLNREKATQIWFEKFNVPKFYLAIGNVLSLYASGRKNGIVLDCGETVTHTIPVIDGYGVYKAIRRTDYGGRSVNTYLKKYLNDAGYSSVTQTKFNIDMLKESLCYVSNDYNNELLTNKSVKEYKLPDGKLIKIAGVERFKCCELLFQPSLMNSKMKGLHELIYESIQVCDDDKRKMLFNNIILAGGSTLFNGLTKRIEYDLSKLVNDNTTKIRIISPSNRRYSAWIGGSILVSLQTFQSMFITKAEYEEHGVEIVHKKCK